MDPPNDPAEVELVSAWQEVVGILDSQKPWKRGAELIVGVMTGFIDIVGQFQDAGADRPFDLRSVDDGLRIDVKTQRGGVLDVKKEKVGKQYQSWAASGCRFVPVQVVLDKKTGGWYVVAGIPTASKTPLDPLDTQFDPTDPSKPFCIGRCSRDKLRDRERFAEMRTKLNQALKDVRENGEKVRAKLDREYQAYVAQVAEHVLEEEKMHQAVIRSIGNSDKAMTNLAKSDEAMTRLAQSEEAMSRLAQSDQAIANLIKSDDAMTRLAQSEEAMRKLLEPEMFEIWKSRQNKPKS